MIITFLKFIYIVVTALAAPIVYFYLRFLSAKTPKYGVKAKELLGFVPKIDYEHPLWIHTVSVGESIGAIPLIKEIRDKNPNLKIVVTTSTTTSRQLYKNIGSNITHLYCPLDSTCAIKRFLKRVNPQGLVIMETELWPNILRETNKLNVPITIINARLSDRSFGRYKKINSYFKELIGNKISYICCQNLNDLNNFKSLGISEKKLATTGSLKFDIKTSNSFYERAQSYQEFFNNKLVFTVASTHEGEDLIVLNLYKKLKLKFNNLILLLIPRHPERFDSVYELACKENLKTQKRSDSKFDNDVEVIIGNTMGELPFYFLLSDLILMGGSMVDIGGHNPIEPIAYNKPTLTGPYIRNFNKIYKDLVKEQATKIIALEDLESQITELLQNSENRELLAKNGQQFLKANSGAQEKTYHILKDIYQLQ